jgi:hypothetical protein
MYCDLQLSHNALGLMSCQKNHRRFRQGNVISRFSQTEIKRTQPDLEKREKTARFYVNFTQKAGLFETCHHSTPNSCCRRKIFKVTSDSCKKHLCPPRSVVIAVNRESRPNVNPYPDDASAGTGNLITITESGIALTPPQKGGRSNRL